MKYCSLLFFLSQLALPLHASPTIGMARLSPQTAVIGTPTPITIRVSITDPSLIAGSINLIQVNSDGSTTILGTLHDDGLNGDLFAADQVFTIVVSLNQASAAQVQLEVSAAFKGSLARVKSPVMSVVFQPAGAPQQALASLSQSLSSGDRTTALTYVNASNNGANAIKTLSQQGLTFLATCLSNSQLVSSSVDSRTFQCPMTVQGGSVANMEFDMVPRTNGQWVINSW